MAAHSVERVRLRWSSDALVNSNKLSLGRIMKTCILFAMIMCASGLKIRVHPRHHHHHHRPSVMQRFKGVSKEHVRSAKNLRRCSTEPGKEPLRDAWSDFLAQSGAGAYRSSQSRADLGHSDGLSGLTGASLSWGNQWIICGWRRLVGVVRAILVQAAFVASIILGDPATTLACAATVAGAQQPSRAPVELVARSDSDVHENVAGGHEHGGGAVEDYAAYVQLQAECDSDIRGLQPYTEIIRFLETVVDERMQSAEPWGDGIRNVEHLSGTERHGRALWLILQVACAAVGGGLIALCSTGSQGSSDDLRLRFQPTPAVSLLSAYTFIGSATRDATFGYSYVGTLQEGSAPQGAGGLALGSADPLLCAAFSSVCFTLGFVIACVF